MWETAATESFLIIFIFTRTSIFPDATKSIECLDRNWPVLIDSDVMSPYMCRYSVINIH